MHKSIHLFLSKNALKTIYALFIILLLPIAGYSDKLIDPVLIPRQFVLSIFNLVVLGFFYFSKEKQEIPAGRALTFFIILSGFVLFHLASISWAVNKTEAFVSFIKMLNLAIFIFHCTLFLLKDSSRFLFVSTSIAIASMVFNIFGLFHVFALVKDGSSWFNLGDAQFLVSLLGNKNMYSIYLLYSIPFILYSIVKGRLFTKLVSLLALLSSLYFIVVLHTRSVWLALIIGSMGLTILFISRFFLLVWKKKDKRTALIYLAFILFLMGSVFFIVKNKSGNTYLNSFLTIKSNVENIKTIRQKALLKKNPEVIFYKHEDSSVNTRLFVWFKTWELIKKHPLRGVGSGNWRVAFPSVGLPFMNYSVSQGYKNTQRAHNDYLQLTAETGITGMLLFISLAIMLWTKSLKTFFNPGNREQEFLSIFMMLSLMFIGVISFFDFPAERAMPLMLTGITASFIISLDKQGLSVNKRLIVVLLLISVGIGYINRNRLKAEKAAKKITLYHANQEWMKIKESYHPGRFRLYPLDPFSMPLSWYAGVSLFSLGQQEAAFKLFKEAERQHPYHVHVLNNIGTCKGLTGKPDLAEKYYRKALAISPYFEDAIINLASLLYNQGKKDEAFDVLLDCPVYSTHAKYEITIVTITRAKIIKTLGQDKVLIKKTQSLLANNERIIEIFKNYQKNFEEKNFYVFLSNI